MAATTSNDTIELSCLGNASLQTTIESLYDNKHLSDIVFSICEESVSAHRFILAVRSGVFQEMFYGGTADKTATIQINDIRMNTFKTMLLYIYTDKLMILRSNATELLYAAHKYNIENLEMACINYIERNITISNALATVNKLYKMPASYVTITKLKVFFCTNFQKMNLHCFNVIDNSFVLRCLIEKLTKIRPASAQHLAYLHSDLFQMVINWGKMKCQTDGKSIDADNIRTVVDDVIELIKFNQMNVEMVQKCIAICPGFFTAIQIGDMIENCVQSSELSNERCFFGFNTESDEDDNSFVVRESELETSTSTDDSADLIDLAKEFGDVDATEQT